MSATETLTTQLDAPQVERNALLAENWMERTDKANEIDLENEMAGSREENIGLSQTVTRLEVSIVHRGETKGRTGELRQSVESLYNTHDTAALRAQLEEMASRLAESQSELRAMTTRAKDAEECSRRLEEDRERTKRGAELEVFRAVAKETKKWEQREARLVKRIDELELAKAKAELQCLHKSLDLTTGTGLVHGTGLKLGSKLASSPPTTTTTAPPLSLPPLSSLTATSSGFSLSSGGGLGGLGLSSSFSLRLQKELSQKLDQPLKHPPDKLSLSGGGLALPAIALALSSTNTQQQQTASLSQLPNQQQPLLTLGVSAALPSSGNPLSTANLTKSQPSLASTSTASSLPSAALFTNSAAQPGPSSLPSLQLPTISASSTQPTRPKCTFAPMGSRSGNISARSTVSMSGGLRLGYSGAQTSVSSSGTVSGFSLLSQTSSSGQTLGVQLATSAPMQNSTTGGIFKLGETPTAVTSIAATTSGVLTLTAEPAQLPQQKPIFGGGLQQTQNPAGGLTLEGSGGIFGTPSTTASTSTLSSTATMGSESVGKPTSTPTLNFGSSTASPQPRQVSAASLLFGGGSTAIGTVDFSGLAGQAGTTLGASGSRMGLKFGAAPPAQGAGNVGLNFSAGSNPIGGLNFGNPMATPGNQTSSTPATCSQIPTGGLFGQTNNSSAGGGGVTLSQTTPSNPAPQQPFGGFKFTPQPPSTSGSLEPLEESLGPRGSIVELFSLYTESSRPPATTRRRRGRRK